MGKPKSKKTVRVQDEATPNRGSTGGGGGGGIDWPADSPGGDGADFEVAGVQHYH